jgi:hypothetical protein
MDQDVYFAQTNFLNALNLEYKPSTSGDMLLKQLEVRKI